MTPTCRELILVAFKLPWKVHYRTAIRLVVHEKLRLKGLQYKMWYSCEGTRTTIIIALLPLSPDASSQRVDAILCKRHDCHCLFFADFLDTSRTRSTLCEKASVFSASVAHKQRDHRDWFDEPFILIWLKSSSFLASSRKKWNWHMS